LRLLRAEVRSVNLALLLISIIILF